VTGLGEQITRCVDPTFHPSRSHPNPAVPGRTTKKEHDS
jgi:hypothetical protein